MRMFESWIGTVRFCFIPSLLPLPLVLPDGATRRSAEAPHEPELWQDGVLGKPAQRALTALCARDVTSLGDAERSPRQTRDRGTHAAEGASWCGRATEAKGPSVAASTLLAPSCYVFRLQWPGSCVCAAHVAQFRFSARARTWEGSHQTYHIERQQLDEGAHRRFALLVPLCLCRVSSACRTCILLGMLETCRGSGRLQ